MYIWSEQLHLSRLKIFSLRTLFSSCSARFFCWNVSRWVPCCSTCTGTIKISPFCAGLVFKIPGTTRDTYFLADFSEARTVLLVPPLVLLGFLLCISELLLSSLQPVGHRLQLSASTQQLLSHLLFLHLQTQLCLPHLRLLHLQFHAVFLWLQPNLLDLGQSFFFFFLQITSCFELGRFYNCSINVVLTNFQCNGRYLAFSTI